MAENLETTATKISTDVNMTNYFDVSNSFCPALFRMGYNLTKDEKIENMHDPRGIWAASLIKLFSNDIDEYPLDSWQKSTLAEIGYCFANTDPQHFESTEDRWIDEEKHFVGEKTGHDPTQEEWSPKYFEQDHNSERFRVWYALMFPEKVKLRKITPSCELFLKMAERIAGPGYPLQSKLKIAA